MPASERELEVNLAVNNQTKCKHQMECILFVNINTSRPPTLWPSGSACTTSGGDLTSIPQLQIDWDSNNLAVCNFCQDAGDCTPSTCSVICLRYNFVSFGIAEFRYFPAVQQDTLQTCCQQLHMDGLLQHTPLQQQHKTVQFSYMQASKIECGLIIIL